MKLSNKILIIISLTAIIFISIVMLTDLSKTNIILAAALSFIIIAATSIVMLKKRINALTQSLNLLNVNDAKASQIEISGQDEISKIAQQFNQIIETIYIGKNRNKELLDEYVKELQKTQLLLQNEKTKRTLAEKKINRDKQYLTQIARYDNLTSLPNPVFFNEILNKSISQAKRHHKILAVMIINIDAFSQVAAKLKFDSSNNVIKEIGRRFAQTLRAEDILAKLDADEFIVLLNDIGKTKFAGTVAEKILKTFEQSFHVENEDIQLTASIGISIYPDDGLSLEDILKNADEALYQAKNRGGNDYELYSKEMNKEAHEHHELESNLREAINNQELILHYQPKYHLRKGTIAGIETLVRWEHPTLGLIPPSKFIPMAEESGMMGKLGEWILREACRINKFWQDEGFEHLTISVNLSAKQFHDPNITKIIQDILTETGLSPGYLELEITEKIVMDDAELASNILNNLKTIGVQLSIDHFGTGYTSISHLKIFPINAIKIDQSFIKGIPVNPNDVAITVATISLAHNLGFKIIAEGVESAEQVQFLANHDCDMVQGYFLSHPLPASKISLQFKNLREGVLM